MCDFEEPYFGAAYPDACCIEGYLWDLDSAEAPGSNMLTSGGDVPCPQCNHELWLDDFKEQVEIDGYEAAESKLPREYVHKKVKREQPGDEAKLKAWWLAGYDSRGAEIAEGKEASSIW